MTNWATSQLDKCWQEEINAPVLVTNQRRRGSNWPWNYRCAYTQWVNPSVLWKMSLIKLLSETICSEEKPGIYITQFLFMIWFCVTSNNFVISSPQIYFSVVLPDYMYIHWRGSVISLRNNVNYKQLAGNIVTFCRKHAGSGPLIFFC